MVFAERCSWFDVCCLHVLVVACRLLCNVWCWLFVARVVFVVGWCLVFVVCCSVIVACCLFFFVLFYDWLMCVVSRVLFRVIVSCW